MRTAHKLLIMSSSNVAAQLYAVTTGAQTVTIQRWTATRDQWINWGDGTAATLVPANSTGSITHDYAGAGTYPITISGNPADVTYVRIDDVKIGFNPGTVGRWRNASTLILNQYGYGGTYSRAYIDAGEIGALPALTELHIAICPNVTIGAGEIGSKAMTALYLSQLPATIGAGEIGALADTLTFLAFNSITVQNVAGEFGSPTKVWYLYLENLSQATISAGEIDNLTACSELYLTNIPGLTMNADEIGTLGTLGGTSRPTAISLVGLPNCAFQTGLSNLRRITTFAYCNSLSQAQVDSVLAQLYAVFPTRTGTGGTITLSNHYGSYANAAPSGVYQAACPPTTGKEYCYELINDTCNVSPNHWSTITVTGGLP